LTENWGDSLRQIREVDNPEYDAYAPTKVLTMGHITEVLTMKKPSLAPPIRKLSKDLYEYIPTGEVRDFEHHDTRADDAQSVRRTLAHIRALINTNVTDAENCRWVTLTYAENMTDTVRLYEDFRRFWQRFCYWCKKEGYQRPDYITVQEPQGRGAWHVHAFFIWPTKAPYIPNNAVMAVLWGHGFTSTKALDDVDNIGAYFSAYLADMPLEEYQALPDSQRVSLDLTVKEFTNADDLTKSKKFVKGGRLGLYPAGMNIVRKTKGIKLPEVERMTYAEAQKKVSSAKLTFSRSFEIVTDDGDVCNTMTKSYYNSKRN
jgi:hypothetical protein